MRRVTDAAPPVKICGMAVLDAIGNGPGTRPAGSR
jgi:hypothetical protein